MTSTVLKQEWMMHDEKRNYPSFTTQQSPGHSSVLPFSHIPRMPPLVQLLWWCQRDQRSQRTQIAVPVPLFRLHIRPIRASFAGALPEDVWIAEFITVEKFLVMESRRQLAWWKSNKLECWQLTCLAALIMSTRESALLTAVTRSPSMMILHSVTLTFDLTLNE